MKLLSFNRRQIRIEEIPELVNNVVAVVEKYNPTTLGIQPFFDLLQTQQSQLKVLKARKTVHPLTDSISKNRKRRMELSIAIVRQYKTVSKANMSTMRDSVHLLQPLLVKEFQNTSVKNSKTLAGNVEIFLELIYENEALLQAAKVMGIEIYIKELKVVQKLISTDEATRRTFNSGQKIISEQNLKMTTLKSITDLFKAIELAMVHNQTVDYTTVVAELNEIIVSYRSMTRSRSTINSNAIKEETVALSTKTTATAS